MTELKEEFERKLSETPESEKANLKSSDTKRLKELVTGRKEIFIEGVGTVVFDYPTPDVMIQADEEFAMFKTKKLKDKTLFPEKKLKAMLHEAGDWTYEDDDELSRLEEERKAHDAEFNIFRESIQTKETFALEATESRAENINEEVQAERDVAFQHFMKVSESLKKLLEKISERRKAFSISIEEVGYLNKIKTLAPSCIKKRDGDKVDFLWKSEEEFFNDPKGTMILTIFDAFLRGWDISFFD